MTSNTDAVLATKDKTAIGAVWGLKAFNPDTIGSRDRPVLRGGIGTPWHSARQNAKCKNQAYPEFLPHPSPDPSCDCGIYMWDPNAQIRWPRSSHYSALEKLIADSLAKSVWHGTVVALVMGFNEVYAFREGWRVRSALITTAFTVTPEATQHIRSMPGLTKPRPKLGLDNGVTFTEDADEFRLAVYEAEEKNSNLIPIPAQEV